MVQNHLESIPWTKYLGSTLQTRYLGPITWIKIPWTKYQGPKLSYPTCTHLFFYESVYVLYAHLLVCEPACTHGLVNGELAYTSPPSFCEPEL